MAGHALVHYASGAVYSFIPKNGCSTLRYTLALANNCIAGPEDWTWIHNNNSTFCAGLRDLATAPYSFVILRCPFTRLASVFLDKLVDKTPELWSLHRLLREGFDPDRLTFRDFVGLLKQRKTLNANIHWRAQVDFLIYDRYSDVFALERFGQACQVLKERIGLEVADARGLSGHGTDTLTLRDDVCFADTPIVELAAMKRAGEAPAHSAFYDAALIPNVRQLYKADLELCHAHFGSDNLLFPN